MLFSILIDHSICVDHLSKCLQHKNPSCLNSQVTRGSLNSCISMIKRSGLRTDLELLVNDAILLGKPVNAVVALAHPKTKNIKEENGYCKGSSDVEAKKVNVITLNLTKPHLRMAPQMA